MNLATLSPESGPDLSRRAFLRNGSFAAAASLLGGVELVAAAEVPADAPETVAKVPCALVGLGPWGREMLTTLARIPRARVAAICDTYPASLKRAAVIARGAEAIADARQVFENQEIRAVFVATPSHLHRELAIEALRAGKHVYCEAPMASRSEDARAIALAARQAAPRLHFQVGLQGRADPLRHLVASFFKAGTAGKVALARAQWNRKHPWRYVAPNPAREKEVNWRLDPRLSAGLMGEIAVHHFDAASWFLGIRPTAVSGSGAVRLWTDDGRQLPDTAQAVLEYPEGLRFTELCTLANSFDSEHEVYYGSDAAMVLRGGKAWMFKEADAPLLGWEVHARKEPFYKDTGLVLVANASKQKEKPATEGATDGGVPELQISPLHHALEAFLRTVGDLDGAAQDFVAAYGSDDSAALRKHLEGVPRQPAAGYTEGFESAIIAIQANEAVLKGSRIELQPEWFELG